MTYRVEHSKWEDGQGYSYTEVIDNTEHGEYGTAQAYAEDWIANDPDNDYSGDKFEVIDNETDEVVDVCTID